MRLHRLPALARGSLALGLLLGLAFAAGPAAAQWKWRDKDGQIQYSDLPPPKTTPQKDILMQPERMRRLLPEPAAATPPASAPAATKAADPELESRRRKAEAEAAAKTPAKTEDPRQAAARAEACARARGHLRALEDGARMSRTNEKGEREALDDTARAAEVQRTREVIANDCR